MQLPKKLSFCLFQTLLKLWNCSHYKNFQI